MKKSDLRTGMIVTTREGKEYVFVKDFITEDVVLAEDVDVTINLNHAGV